MIDVLRANIRKVATGDQFKTAIANIGDEVAYLDQADFAKFWDDGRQTRRSRRAIDRPRVGRFSPPPRSVGRGRTP